MYLILRWSKAATSEICICNRITYKNIEYGYINGFIHFGLTTIGDVMLLAANNS